MAVTGRLRRGYLIAFLLLVAAIVVPTIVRMNIPTRGPAIILVSPQGEERSVDLKRMQGMHVLTRRGIYQNQFGNWRDEGIYTGVLLSDLIGRDVDFKSVRVVASDGYEVKIDRARVLDPAYPMVLAYAFDGKDVPAWPDGFRIAVLPDDGAVSNEEYNAVSAGSFWVKNVERLILSAD